jgi:hypothetical protein
MRVTGLVIDVTEHKKTEEALLALGFDFAKQSEAQKPE